MKRILLVFALVCVMSLGTFAWGIDWTGNLVPNHDFEDYPNETEAPTDWRFFAVGGAEGTVTRVTDSYSGNYAVKITWDNAWAPGQDSALDHDPNFYDVTPNEHYVAGGYVKSANSSTFRIKTPTFDETDTHLGDHTAESAYWKNATTEYDLYYVEFTAESNAATGHVTFQLVTTNGGMMTIDKAFVLTKADFEAEITGADSHWIFYE